MYELFSVALIFCIQHIAIAYATIEIWKLDYRTYLMVTTGISLVLALVVKVLFYEWKDRIAQAIRGELEDRELLPDLVLMMITVFIGATVSAVLVYRRYGITGWLGAYATNVAVSYLV